MRKQLLILAAACVAVTAMGANPVQGRLENVKRLTSQTDLKFENPQFSPDGKQIAFTKLGYEGIYVMDADGANTRSISNAMGVGYMYQWSPDSRQILALEASSDRTKTLAPTLHAVVTLDVADGTRVQVTEPAPEVRPAAWRISGNKYCAATTDRGLVAIPGAKTLPVKAQSLDKANLGALNTSFVTDLDHLYAIDANGNKAIIYDGDAFLPKLSPNGKQVAFCDILDNIRVMNIDGTGMKIIGKGFAPSWVNDTQLVFERTTDDGHTYQSGELYLGDVNGTTPVALTNTSRSIEMNASVSPDGKKIVYTDFNDGQVYVADLK